MPRGNKIFLLFNGAGKKQTDKDIPLATADFDTRINVTSRNWVNTDKTIDEIFDCVAEELTGKEVTRIIYKLPIEGQFVARIMAVLAAYCMGVAASPSGSTVNASQTITVDGTGGSFVLPIVVDGITSNVTIPVGATAAQFKYAIESSDAVGFGNTTVGLAGTAPYVYTIVFVGKRAAAPIATIVPDATNVTGGAGTVVAASVATGQQITHNITEMPTATYQPPYTSFAIGFEDEAGSERILFGAVIDDLKFTGAANNGKVTFSGNLIIRNKQVLTGLTIPTCVVYRPTRTADCLFTRNSVDYSATLREFEYSYNNNILTGDTAYTGRSVRPSRLERANKRTRQLTYGILGGVINSLYQEAEGNPEANVLRATLLRIGPAGDSLTLNIPNGLTELNTGGGLSFDGESEEAVDRFIDTPTKQSTTLPTNIVAKVPLTAQMLLTD